MFVRPWESVAMPRPASEGAAASVRKRWNPGSRPGSEAVVGTDESSAAPPTAAKRMSSTLRGSESAANRIDCQPAYEALPRASWKVCNAIAVSFPRTTSLTFLDRVDSGAQNRRG